MGIRLVEIETEQVQMMRKGEGLQIGQMPDVRRAATAQAARRAKNERIEVERIMKPEAPSMESEHFRMATGEA
jgi:hypothetical protein